MEYVISCCMYMYVHVDEAYYKIMHTIPFQARHFAIRYLHTSILDHILFWWLYGAGLPGLQAGCNIGEVMA